MKLSRLLALAAAGIVAGMLFTRKGRQIRRDFSVAAGTVAKNSKKNINKALQNVSDDSSSTPRIGRNAISDKI